MDSRIKVVREGPRGCGWRKTHGMYLRSGGEGQRCGFLPIPFATCPCCGFGIKPSRQPTWVDADKLLYSLTEEAECSYGEDRCSTCPIYRMIDNELGEALLVWVGERHYPTIELFESEAVEMGISRRIQSVPRGFEIGRTWVLLAHPKGIAERVEFGEEPEWIPAIFRLFKPTAIDIVVTGEESEEEVTRMIEYGLTPIRVERIEAKQTSLI